MSASPPEKAAFPFDLDEIASGKVSDDTIRKTLRFGLAAALHRLDAGGVASQLERKMQLIRSLRDAPLLVHAAAANEQHYEVNTELWGIMLGKRMKYSCAFWDECSDDLDTAQEAMLKLTVERASLRDGQTVLDVGCGWGSLALYLAERFPSSTIVAFSNSHSQKTYIDALAQANRLTNIQVYTANVSDWHTDLRFDRILSFEMFEHMRNYEMLLAKIANWLKPDGQLFVQVFAHIRHAYLFENSWMADHFFTGGMMPSDDLFLHFQRDLLVAEHWAMDGTHYRRTAQAWLDRLDAQRERALTILGNDLAPTEAIRALTNWRLYLLGVIEAWGYSGGKEWIISHYLFKKPG